MRNVLPAQRRALVDIHTNRRKQMKFLKKLVLVVGMMTVIVAAGATIAFANPGTLITTTILGARATLSDDVRVNQDGVKFRTKQPTDVLAVSYTHLRAHET